MVLPSKELLFEVIDDLSPRVVEVIDIYQDNLLSTYYDCGKGEPNCLGYEINIYELMHMMKEWAKEEGYSIMTGTYYDKYYYAVHNGHVNGYTQTDGTGRTEPEATTKACEWILEQQK